MNQHRTQQTSRQGDQAAPQRSGIHSQTDMRPIEDLIHYVRDYTRDRPETVAIACLAVGFILGWRLKPW
jgi:hypothetical protein